MLRQSCIWVSYLAVYQQLRQIVLTQNKNFQPSLTQKVFLGGATGGLVAVIIAPFDLLKTRAQKADATKNEKLFISVRMIVNNHGLKGLYNGLSIKILRQTYSSSIILVVLDRLGALPIGMRISNE